MKNTLNLFAKAKEYQDKRKEIIDNYEARLKALEKMRGSEYFKEETEKAAKDRDTALSSLKDEYRGGFGAILHEMKAVSSRRATEAPTAEELRIVQALKLRDFDSMRNMNKNAVAEELNQIAHAVKGNALCLSIVQDTARKYGILGDYMGMYTGSNMPAASVYGCIDLMGSRLKEFMDYDTSTPARIAREAHERRYGKMDETKPREFTGMGYSAGYTPLPKRPLFNSREEMFKTLFNMDGETLSAFTAAVDD